MSVMIREVYEALTEAGASEEKASAAAQAVTEKLVTKDDLQLEIATLRGELTTQIAEAKAEIIKWNVGTLVALTAIFTAIVKLL